MKIEATGHAGLYLETNGGSILCDPWLYPAYFASWFPFPDNSGLDWDRLGECDYLYVSHLHKDHFDRENLALHVRKSATVLLPEFPSDELERALRSIGFREFLRLPNNRSVELQGMRVMIAALTSPSDGPLGDSALAVDDGTALVLNQNDAHPMDFRALEEFAGDQRFTAHFLQFSGAIWWPVVYDLPQAEKSAIGAEKRTNGMARALRYADQLDAAFLFPTSGPACFLDGELRWLNDVERDPASIFPDQSVFLDFMTERGHGNGRLMIPGSTAELQGGRDRLEPSCRIVHPVPDDDVVAMFEQKGAYLDAYAERQRSRIESEKRVWADRSRNVMADLQTWFKPLLHRGVHFRSGVGAAVEFVVAADDADAGNGTRGQDLTVVIDFAEGVVRPPRDGDEYSYRFRAARPLVERLIANHEIDWSNSLFLSMRFQASRVGPYNEFLYTFFKCLSLTRIQYAEEWYSSLEDSDEETIIGDWCIQRRCPHLRADLARFGAVEGPTLTCHMHGWQWDLVSGECLTSAGHHLRSRPTSGDRPPAAAVTGG